MNEIIIIIGMLYALFDLIIITPKEPILLRIFSTFFHIFTLIKRNAKVTNDLKKIWIPNTNQGIQIEIIFFKTKNFKKHKNA